MIAPEPAVTCLGGGPLPEALAETLGRYLNSRGNRVPHDSLFVLVDETSNEVPRSSLEAVCQALWSQSASHLFVLAPGWKTRSTDSDATRAARILEAYGKPVSSNRKRLLRKRLLASLYEEYGYARVLKINYERVAAFKSAPPWGALGAGDAARFIGYCSQIPGLNFANVLLALAKKPGTASPLLHRHRKTRCLEEVFARRIWQDLKQISHGRVADAVNTVLAPARILCLADGAGRKAWNSWIRSSKSDRRNFSNVVSDPPKKEANKNGLKQILDWGSKYFVSSAVLYSDWKIAADWLGADSPAPRGAQTPALEAVERLMQTLTHMRELATDNVERNEKAVPASDEEENTGSNPCKAIEVEVETPGPADKETGKVRDAPRPYRILVVDDHCSSWREVFELVAKKMIAHQGKNARGVAIEFSTDYKTVTVPGRASHQNLKQRMLEYDLVLLDIYLRRAVEVNGLKLLKEIRTQSLSLPTIMWTSSLARQLPADANLANGFLFKKTTTIQEMVPLLHDACVEGEAKRKYSLMHPFFNDAIHSVAEREIARQAESWVMRLYATFHAQSFDVYRSFNDHSAHHISNVLDNVQKIFRNAGVGNQYVFSLYIGTLLHEIGMFPFNKVESKIFGMPERGKKFVRRVRQFHAIRGMVMMLCTRLWKDDFKDIRKLLDPITSRRVRQRERVRIATIVGYHARNIDKCLECEDNSALFLDNFNRRHDITGSDKLTKEFTRKPPVLKKGDLECALSHLSEMDQSDEKTKRGKISEDLDALRQTAAILRFSDALDIDFTRNPMRRFTYARERNFRDDVENYKRMVVRNVEITLGTVCVKIAAPPPSKALLEWLNKVDKHFELLKEDVLAAPWASDNRACLEKFAESFNDLILEPFWAACHQEEDDIFSGKNQQKTENQKKALKAMTQRLLDAEKDRNRRQTLLAHISTVTGLFVAGDLVSEYQAIKDCELREAIGLGEVEWKWNEEKDPDLEFLDKTPFFNPPSE